MDVWSGIKRIIHVFGPSGPRDVSGAGMCVSGRGDVCVCAGGVMVVRCVWVWEVMLTADCPDGSLAIGVYSLKLPHSSQSRSLDASLMMQ